MAVRGDEITKITIDFSNGMYLELDKTSIEHVMMEMMMSGKGAIEMRLVFDTPTWAHRDDLPIPPQRLKASAMMIEAGD